MMALLALRRLLEGGSPILIRCALKPNKSLLSRVRTTGPRFFPSSTCRVADGYVCPCERPGRGRPPSSLYSGTITHGGLGTSFDRCHLEALLVVAARCDFTDVVDAFATASPSLLVKRLNASTERSQPESPLKPIAKFSVGDTVVSFRAEEEQEEVVPRLGRARWHALLRRAVLYRLVVWRVYPRKVRAPVREPGLVVLCSGRRRAGLQDLLHWTMSRGASTSSRLSRRSGRILIIQHRHFCGKAVPTTARASHPRRSWATSPRRNVPTSMPMSPHL